MDNKLRIINFLGKIKEQFTMHELSKLLKIPYATFYRTIQTMPDILTKKKAGKANLIQLNKRNPILKHFLIISSNEEKDEYLKKQPLIRKITDELPIGQYTVILFGSYAKCTHTPKSDIDLLVINKKGERKPDFSRYEILFKITINPIYVTKKEFITMLKEEEENVAKQALKNNIILYNLEMFWNLAYEL